MKEVNCDMKINESTEWMEWNEGSELIEWKQVSRHESFQFNELIEIDGVRYWASEITSGPLHSLIHSIHWMWWSESNAAWIQSPIEESKAQQVISFKLN